MSETVTITGHICDDDRDSVREPDDRTQDLTENPSEEESLSTAETDTSIEHAMQRSARPPKRGLVDRIEAWLSRLSTKNNFWHRVCSLVWLPYAFRSGITMKRLDSKRFRAVLPFRRFNRNWYNAMAGAALLGNSEVAAGMYLFSECGSDYTVVCKELNYKFLRPCLGPAVYEVVNSEDVEKKIAAGGEFNIDVEMEVRQQLKRKDKESRVGRCYLTFHCTPKTHAKKRKKTRKARK